MKSTALAALLAASVLTLSGCSGDGGEPEESSPSTATDTPSEGGTPGIITPTDIPTIPTFTNEAKGIIDDVDLENCDLENGTVTANGTATNSGQFARDLVVVINWAVASTSDVVARGVAEIEDVEPGDSADWSVEATLDSDQPVQCVTTALAGQLPD